MKSLRIAGLATVPGREKYRNETIESLLSQVDHIYVYMDYPIKAFNNLTRPYHHKVTYQWEWEGPKWGDAGKFIGAWSQSEDTDFYYFSCDDDLVYPPTYAQDMIDAYHIYEGDAVISLHGSYFTRFPITSYYKDKKTIPCLSTVYDNHQVMCPGTGAMLFHSSLWRPLPEMFPERNMADIWAGIALQKAHIPVVAVAHELGYLRYQNEIPLSETIWGREFQQDQRQTNVVNQFAKEVGWSYPSLPFRLDEGAD